MQQIEVQLIHSEDKKINAPDHILRSAQSLLASFDTGLQLVAIYRLKITPELFRAENEKQRLTIPELLVMLLEGGNKLMYCDMHVCTIPILILKADEIFAFPGSGLTEFSKDGKLMKVLQSMQL